LLPPPALTSLLGGREACCCCCGTELLPELPGTYVVPGKPPTRLLSVGGRVAEKESSLLPPILLLFGGGGLTHSMICGDESERIGERSLLSSPLRSSSLS
jgi:hypothetical protein